MLIDFDLTPIEDVGPWGTPGDHSLTWFGLTEGRYWINAGADTLLEYSEHANRNDADRYCDYYVARIYEDVVHMLPAVLEVVPPDLRKYVAGNSGREWIETYNSWSGQNLDEDAGNEASDVADRAASLFSERLLNTGYLSPPATILMWSDETDVHIEWDNRDKFIDGILAWSATSGNFNLPREQFVKEVESFRTRLLEQGRIS